MSVEAFEKRAGAEVMTVTYLFQTAALLTTLYAAVLLMRFA